MSKGTIKKQIEEALRHPEAEDGLYFNNLIVVHEEEERPIVVGEESEILAALKELVDEGRVLVTKSANDTIYRLA